MATATLNLPVTAGQLPDGSASNAAPQFTRRKGSETAPAKHFVTADFDPSTDEHLWFTFTMPQNYASGPVLRVVAMANATTGVALVGVRMGAISSGDADTPLEHASAAASTATWTANVTEARGQVTQTITVSNADSVAAGDLVFLLFYRDADGTAGTDSLSVDLEVISLSLDYTTT